MKRAKIGNTDVPVNAAYWTGGKRSSRLRQSEKELYAKINLLQELADISENGDEIQLIYTEMDMLYVVIQLIMNFGDDSDLLLKAGVAFSDAVNDGQFHCLYESLEERNIAVNELASGCIAQVPDILLSEDVITDVILWWKATVLEQNFYLDETTGEKKSIPSDSNEIAIGGYETDEFSQKMVEGGMYYVYCISDDRLIDSPQSMYKRSQQNITIDRLENLGYSRSVMMDNIKTGILRTSKGSASQSVQVIRNKEGRIGEPVTVTVAVVIGWVVAALGAVATITASILANRKAKVEKETAQILSKDNLSSIRPDGSDYPGGSSSGQGGLKEAMDSLGNIGGIPILPIVLIGGSLLLLS